jgi:uncharacterized membrane protein (DUF485 family)
LTLYSKGRIREIVGITLCVRLIAKFSGAIVAPESDDSWRENMLDWVSTALAVAAFFAYVLVIGFAPGVFARPIMTGSLISIGLASGVALTVFLVALAGIYVHLRNKKSST